VVRPPDRPGWSYEGPSLQPLLADVRRVRLLRERVTGGDGDHAFSWTADRGLALTSAAGEDVLILARPAESEQVALVAPPGLYRALLDPTAPAVPGATPAELLGYGDRTPAVDVVVDLEEI
jgi:hypothetical protein